MEASKSFIKSAVGILLVVAICFVAVTLYKKGNDSINSSMKEYDKLISGLRNRDLLIFENTTVTGGEIIELIRNLSEEENITVVVHNGYCIKNKISGQEYTYKSLFQEDSTILQDICDKTATNRYINPATSFSSDLEYGDNSEIISVVFRQQ